jgi:hypothetical protein
MVTFEQGQMALQTAPFVATTCQKRHLVSGRIQSMTTGCRGALAEAGIAVGDLLNGKTASAPDDRPRLR